MHDWGWLCHVRVILFLPVPWIAGCKEMVCTTGAGCVMYVLYYSYLCPGLLGVRRWYAPPGLVVSCTCYTILTCALDCWV